LFIYIKQIGTLRKAGDYLRGYFDFFKYF